MGWKTHKSMLKERQSQFDPVRYLMWNLEPFWSLLHAWTNQHKIFHKKGISTEFSSEPTWKPRFSHVSWPRKSHNTTVFTPENRRQTAPKRRAQPSVRSWRPPVGARSPQPCSASSPCWWCGFLRGQWGGRSLWAGESLFFVGGELGLLLMVDFSGWLGGEELSS